MMTTDPAKVADALPESWVYRLLPHSVWPYAQLARWERPIGWWLLLWPCWWSLALAVALDRRMREFSLPLDGYYPSTVCWQLGIEGSCSVPSFALIALLLLLGAVAMRGAGCTYNDLVDAKLDAMVARTASRPIPSGRVSPISAKVFLVMQALLGFAVLVILSLFSVSAVNTYAFFLGIASLAIVALYPFAKRITDWPQFVLGLAFSWGALMGWAVVFGSLSAAPILLYAGSILWVIGYDTIYAHQDREDDALVGVRSTARLFGERTKPALVALYSGTLVLFALAYWLAGAGWPPYLGLAAGCAHMIWQIKALDIDDPDNCLRLFQSNNAFGWVLFGGLVADLFV